MCLTFIAAENVATWYSGRPPYGGCNGNWGCILYLYADYDDDDGDMTNGTPHMQAIFATHNRQGFACDKPKVQDSGCLNTPNEAPVVVLVVPGSMHVTVKWTAVDSATNYQIFCAESINKFSQEKVLVATVASDVLNHTDSGLINGRKYYYLVIAKGSDDACFGPAIAYLYIGNPN
jgi:hypothetical protein